MSRTHVCIQVGALAAWAFACDPRPPVGDAEAAQTSEQRPFAFRVLTFNTLLNTDAPGYPDAEDIYHIPQAQRAELIAHEILSQPELDAVALQEVFDEDARQTLINQLEAVFPHYISKIDRVADLNDSGLMFFSRTKMKPLDDPRLYPPGYPTIQGGVVTPSDVYYLGENRGHPYNIGAFVYTGSGWETIAAKGVGVVRVEGPRGHTADVVVAFTHTQADEDGTSVLTRQVQLADAKALLEQVISPERLESEPVFFVGDFNINGAQRPATSDSGAVDDGVAIGDKGGLTFNEWELYFGSRDLDPDIEGYDLSQGYYACQGNQSGPCAAGVLIDSWAYETSAADVGQTQSGEDVGGALDFGSAGRGKRYDYVLHNRPLGLLAVDLCLQHIRRGFPGRRADQISDHLPLLADFNQAAPRCSVRPRQPGDPALLSIDEGNVNGPAVVAFELEDPAAPNFREVTFADAATRIRNPGNVQWYAIDQGSRESPLPLRITVGPRSSGSNPVAFEIYRGQDLSRPVPIDPRGCRAQGERFTCELNLSDGPHYVKVFAALNGDPDHPNAQFTGEYTVSFRRLDCSSMEDACPLEPDGTAGPFLWTSHAQGTPNPTQFYRFQTRLDDQGRAPDLSFSLFLDLPGEDQVNGAPVPFYSAFSLRRIDGSLVAAAASTPAPTFSAPGPDAPAGTKLAATLVPPPGALPGLGRQAEQTYFLRLDRNSRYFDRAVIQRIRFRTSLTYFRPSSLACIEERTDVGNDDILARFAIGNRLVFSMLGEVNGDYETWDDGVTMGPHGSSFPVPGWPRSFDFTLLAGEHIRPDLHEDNLDEPGVGKLLLTQPNDQVIAALEPEQPGDPVGEPRRRIEYRDERRADEAEYQYVMSYSLTHHSPPARTQEDCVDWHFVTRLGHGVCVCQRDADCLNQDGTPSGLRCNVTTGACGP